MAARLFNLLKGILCNIFFKKDDKAAYSGIRPTFQSSFIQYWYAQHWDSYRWEKELLMLKAIGITEVILQSVADTKIRYAAYFSEIPGFIHEKNDMIETALAAADRTDMKVRIGLGFSDDWWVKFFCRSWLSKEASINKAIIDEIAYKYGMHRSFTGWYIPHEFSQFTALTKRQQLKLNGFFKSMASEIKTVLPKDIMISPFYYGILWWITPPAYWSSILYGVLKGTLIDIAALQDSIGVKYSCLRQLSRIFYHSKKAFDKLNIKFYIVIETFTSTLSGNVSAPQNRIEKQLSIASMYTQNLTAFSMDHYQNKNEPDQAEFYNDYYNYYNLRML